MVATAQVLWIVSSLFHNLYWVPIVLAGRWHMGVVITSIGFHPQVVKKAFYVLRLLTVQMETMSVMSADKSLKEWLGTVTSTVCRNPMLCKL